MKVGEFEVSAGAVSGPAAYMNERYPEMIKTIEAGQSAVFNMACQQGQPMEVAVAVALQTDYAGWLGMRQFNQALKQGA